MLKWLGAKVSCNAWWVIGITIAITLVLAVFISRLRTEADLTKMLADNDPAVKTMAVVDSEFGGSTQVALLVEACDIFSPNVLYPLDTLIQAIKGLAGVLDIQGLTTLQDVKGIGDEIVITKIIDSIPKDQKRLQALRSEVLNDKRYRGVLVAEDGSSALFLIRLAPASNKEMVVKTIEKVVNNSSLRKNVSLSGSPALMKYMRDWMQADLKLLLPLAILVLAFILLISFRSGQGFLPLVAVLMAVIWTLGLIGLLGKPLTIVMVVLPPILVSVGSAYGIHILARFRQERNNGKTSIEAASRAVSNTGLPVFLAAATTMVGFAANMVSGIVSIRQFGLFSAIGVFFALVIALTFVPAVLSRWKIREDKSLNSPKKNESNRLGELFERWGVIVLRHRLKVIAPALVLVLIAGLFIPRVRSETDFVRYFKPNSQPTRAVQIIAERFGGELQFEFIIEGDIQDPELLRKMENFEKELKEIPHITHTFSIVDILRRTNKAFNGDRLEFELLPVKREEIAQYLLLLSFSDSDFLSDYVTADYRLARITARFDSEESQEIAMATKRINKLIAKHFANMAKVSVGGMPMAIERLHQNIQVSQIITLITALVAVFGLIACLFKSVGLGLVALTPIVLTLALNYGIMGLLKIRQDLVTATLGSIAIGIGIDYSCHLLARFLEETKNNRSLKLEIIPKTLTAVGPAILTNALAVGLGFAVLIFSSFMIIQTFGILIAETMLFSSIGALTVLVALLSWRIKNRR